MRLWSRQFLEAAKQAVAERAASYSHRLLNHVWYKGRKQLHDAPKLALTSIGTLIPTPFVGGFINFAIDQAVEKVKADRAKGKAAEYSTLASAESLASLRKASKWEAKNLKDTADHIDKNHPKLKDAYQASETAWRAYVTACGGPDRVPDRDLAMALAQAIYNREHYEDKILVLVEVARNLLDKVEDYVSKSRGMTTEMERTLGSELDEIDFRFCNDGVVPIRAPIVR